MSDKIFIDANIFLYAFSTLDPAKQLRAKDIVLSPHCVISVQVVNEVSSNLLKKLKLTEEQVIGFVADCYERYALVNFSKSLFVIAANIRQSHRVSYYDSLIVAAALEADCDVLYSEDMAHNQLMGGRVRIVNPFL
jgi:predicted nucleic acid-binding protein